MQLSEVQKLFCDALYGEESALLLPHILSNGIAVTERLAVYRNTLYVNLLNVLKSAYPVTNKLVGEEFFTFLAQEYIKKYPSHSGNLEEYGAFMAVFLSVFPPVLSLPYLPDVAKLEWACHEAYHAEDTVEISVASLQKLAPESYENLRFTLHPSCTLLSSPYPLYRIWEVNQEGYVGEQSVALGAGACHLMIVRDKACVVKLLVIGKAEYHFLQCLQAGGRLYTAYEQAEQTGDSFNLSEAIRKNVEDAVFIAYDYAL